MPTTKKATIPPKPRNLKTPLIIGAFVAILLLAAGVAFYFYREYARSQSLLKTPTQAANTEVSTIVAKVGKLMELPGEEQPTVATVSDVTKLKDQQFFAHAQNGDKVLIYQQAKRAILYRPETNKIVEVGPVNISSNTQGQAAVAGASSSLPAGKAGSVSPTPGPVKLAIFNGTDKTGLTRLAEKDLVDKKEAVIVVDRDNAKASDYTQTLVIDATNGRQKEAAERIAKVLGGKVAPMPAGEEKPKEAEIFIILGNDYASK